MGDMMMSRVTKKMLQASHNKLLNQFAELVRDLKSAKVIGEETCPTFYRRAAGVVEDSCEEPKLKQLDHSVFDGVFEWVKSAAISPSGAAYLYSVKKDGFYGIHNEHGFQVTGKDKCQCIGLGYDTTNWQNSLIERDKVELTGSDLCRAMLERGDKCVMCTVGFLRQLVIIDTLEDGEFYSFGSIQKNPIPINNQGEPLTATDVGL